MAGAPWNSGIKWRAERDASGNDVAYDYLTVRMKVLASGRDEFLRSNSAVHARVELQAEIPDWVSTPLRVPVHLELQEAHAPSNEGL